MDLIRTGSIVWANVSEPAPGGRPAGEHPAVVLNPQAEIDAGRDLIVAVCSTSFDYPLPSGWFEMPTSPDAAGHEVTGLREACVVKATWIQVVPQAQVNRVGKRCRQREFRLIQNWLTEQERVAQRAKRTSGS